MSARAAFPMVAPFITPSGHPFVVVTPGSPVGVLRAHFEWETGGREGRRRMLDRLDQRRAAQESRP